MDLKQQNQVLRLLESSVYRMWQATINNPPLRKLKRELENPEPGDWVLECSTLGHVGYDELRLGTLVRVEQAPDPETKRMETVYVIRTMSGQEIPWRRARVVKVLSSLWGRV